MKHSARFNLHTWHWSTYVLIIIFVLGCGLRFLNLFGWIWDMGGYDESRDMLVARHIVEYGDWVWRGPLAAGGHNILANSPFYYYFIAAIWAVTRTPEMFMVFWAIVMASIIPLGYIIGARLWDKTTGLYIALLFAVHPTFVGMGKFLSQVNLIPLWVLIVLNLVIPRKRWSFISFAASLAILFLGLHIHYGSLIIIASLYIWMSWMWWKHSTVSSRPIRIVYLGLLTEYLVLFWIYATYKYAPFDQFIFLDSNLRTAHPNFIGAATRAITDAGSLLWTGAFDMRAIGVAVMGLLIYGIGCTPKMFSPQVRRFCIWAFMCMSSAYMAVGLYLGHVSLSYLYSLLPFYIIAFGLLLRRIHSMNRYLGVFALLILSFVLIGWSWREMQPTTTESPYRSYKNIAKALATDYQVTTRGTNKYDSLSFVIATLSTSPYVVYDGWANGSTWYWLEEILNERLVRLTDDVTNFNPLVKHPTYFYVICDHRDSGRDSSEICRTRFTKVRDYISESYKVVFASNFYTVWRFDVVRRPFQDIYNVAYDELLHPKE